MKFGRYEILEEVGSGGFGTVYKAQDEVLGRVIALKILHPGLLIDRSFVTRFRNEARLAAQIEHPNLVPIYDFGEIDGRIFITMAYMAGGSLKDKLKEGALSEESLRETIPQLLRGLEVIHENGIVHRDLKPGNILFDQYDIARISDLGFAKALHADSSVSLTMSGGMVGTPAYMAPEVWRGSQATERSDIYSLGCILYEMLTGEVLFEGTSPAEVITKHVVDGPQFRHELGEGWRGLLNKCLAMDPDERYADVKALHEAYDLLLAGDEAEPEDEVPDATEKTPLRERLQNLLGHREAPTVKEAQAEEASETEPAPEITRQMPEALPEEAEQATEVAIQQSDQSEDKKSAEERKVPARKKDERKLMLYASLGILAILLIVLSFSLLKGKNRYAPVAVASATPTHTATQNPTETATQPPSKTPTKTPTRKPTKTPTQAPIQIRTTTREIDGMEMVYVPAGEFEMGGSDADAWDDEKPVHTVDLDAYWIDKYEVSNAQYALCVADGDCTKPEFTSSFTRSSYYGNPEYDNYPVIYVSWHQAQAYCQWAGGDLPTEAQWEKAARGTDGRTYPWGNESPTCQLANYDSGNNNYCVGDTSPVTNYEKGASPYKALNMAGNVWEWVGDRYASDYYSNSPAENPTGSTSGSFRVIRGGSWYNLNWGIRAAIRSDDDPTSTLSYIGFRCALPQP